MKKSTKIIRLSSAVSASKFYEYIDDYNYDKVILIAHSLGGYVASGYLGLGDAQRNKVEQVFYLARPIPSANPASNEISHLKQIYEKRRLFK